MSSIPLFDASPAIVFHVATVVPAAILGAWLLARPKGTRVHKRLGRIWVALMVATSISTFFIHEIRLIGGFSPIHLLSVLVLATSVTAVRAARRGDIAAHRRNVAGMYFGGIVVAGGFTFLPGRIMHDSVFSGEGVASVLTAAVLAFLFVGAGMLAVREMRLPVFRAMRERRVDRRVPSRQRGRMRMRSDAAPAAKG